MGSIIFGNVIKENGARHRRQILAEAEEGIIVDTADPDIIFDDGLDRALLNKPWNPSAAVPNSKSFKNYLQIH